jgi:hypothetical protein
MIREQRVLSRMRSHGFAPLYTVGLIPAAREDVEGRGLAQVFHHTGLDLILGLACIVGIKAFPRPPRRPQVIGRLSALLESHAMRVWRARYFS